MIQLVMDMPEAAFATLHQAPDEFARESAHSRCGQVV